MSIKGRITSKKFIDFVNSELIRLGVVDFECYQVERTRFTQDQYEGGACKLYVRLQRKDGQPCVVPLYFMCFYAFWEYEEFIKEGYEMYLEEAKYMRSLEVKVRKPK